MATTVHFGEFPIAPKLYRGYYETVYTFDDLTAAATSENLTHPKQEPDQSIVAQRMMVTEYFAGGSISAINVKLGTTASVAAHLATVDLFDTTTLNVWLYETTGAGVEGGGFGVAPFDATGDAIARFTCTGDNVDAATAGRIVVGTWYDRTED